MLFVAVVLDQRYRLKYVKFWFREWYGKDKGDAMSSKVRDALKRLYVERMGQNGALSSSGSDAFEGKSGFVSHTKLIAEATFMVLFHS